MDKDLRGIAFHLPLCTFKNRKLMTAMVFRNVTLADTNSPVPLCHIGLCQKFTRAIQFMILNHVKSA
jgi:hypothetical protein